MGEILNFKRAIIFGGNLEEINPEIINNIKADDYIVCADKGYEFVIKNKITPNLIVGDFDSSIYPDFLNCEIIKLPKVKDDTDLHYAVKICLERNIKNYILTGVTGGRLDQTFASINTLNFMSKNGANAKISDYNSEVFITSDFLSLNKPDYSCYFSIFPLEDRAEDISLSGGIYELDNDILTNSFPVGVSNEFESNIVNISVKKGTLLVMIIRKR